MLASLLTRPDIVLAVVITAILAVGLAGTRLPHIHAAAPLPITSLGLLGTFWGVFAKLPGLSFAPDAIHSSSKRVLASMQAAFGTSLVGLAGGIIYRILGPFFAPSATIADRVRTPPPGRPS